MMRKLLFTLFTLALAASCGDVGMVSSKYCSLRARFSFSPVQSISQLYTACTAEGEWCTIRLSMDGKTYLFDKVTGPQGQWPRMRLEGYTGFIMGVTGFIVGLPNIPEVGEYLPVVTCYELACRNCYEEANGGVTRDVQLQENGFARCPRCQRVYNLNNTAQVAQGTPGQPLYRYRASYGKDTFVVNNY